MNLEDLFERMRNDPKDLERYEPDRVLLANDATCRALFEQRVSARLAADYHAYRAIELQNRIGTLYERMPPTTFIVR